MAGGATKLLNDSNFDAEISQGVVLVDFYADWCGPCRMVAPILEKLAEELQGKVTIVKVDTDTSPTITQRFEISSIPTMILFKEGKEVKRVSGVRDADFLRNMIQSAA